MYTVGMFSIKIRAHIRESTSNLRSNMVVDYWYFGAVLPVVQRSFANMIGIMNSTKYQDILAKTWLPLPGGRDLVVEGPSNKTRTPNITQNQHKNGSGKTKLMFSNAQLSLKT